MKLYLDDIRNPGEERMIADPDNWTVFRNVKDFVLRLLEGGTTHVSLDHDLGLNENLTGYDAICAIERAVRTGSIRCPTIYIHTANPSARRKMELARDSIYLFVEKQAELGIMKEEAKREPK